MFHLNDIAENKAIVPAYDDSQWQRVNVPHDYVLDGVYNQTNDEHVISLVQ